MPFSRTALKNMANELRSDLEADSFTLQQALRVLRRPYHSTRRVLWQLTQEGTIVRLGRGLYAFARGQPEPRIISPQGEEIRSKLADLGIDFVISGLDVLLRYVHTSLRRYPSLVFVDPNSIEWTAETLRREDLVPLQSHDKPHLIAGLELAPEDKIVVLLRKLTTREGSEGSIATIERAIVDLYIEVTRDRFPLAPSELVRMIYYSLAERPLKYPKLLHYADRRRVRGEFVTLLKRLPTKKAPPAEYLAGRSTVNRFTEKLPSFDEVMLR